MPNKFFKMFNGEKKSQIDQANCTNLLIRSGNSSSESILKNLNTSLDGLSEEEANDRLKQTGANIIVTEKKSNIILQVVNRFKDPLTLLMMFLVLVAIITNEISAAIIIIVIVLISVSLDFLQEDKSNKAAEKLKKMVSIKASVLRNSIIKEIPLEELVPGDIVHLAAGDMVPADVRLLSAKTLAINQATLTGESMPVYKNADIDTANVSNPIDLSNICLMGSNVISGTAQAVVVLTGKNTYLGALAKKVSSQRVLTSFDKGVNEFTWLMIHFMMIMTPAVFLINGISKGNWFEAFFFAIAIAVGLTPEMLPMIVTVNLAKGALAMSGKKVIVKRLNSIQNFGAMDILCADKTGTLTQNKVVIERHIDIQGKESNKTLELAYLNSYFQTGLKNLMDEQILSYGHLSKQVITDAYKKKDEMPFDFNRKRMSVILETQDKKGLLICKGAVSELINVCDAGEIDGVTFKLDETHLKQINKVVNNLSADGFRIIAVAYKEIISEKEEYSEDDESNLVLTGFIAFYDPPKETANEAIRILEKYGIKIKILTGDNEIVTQKICKEVGLDSSKFILGEQVESKTEDELANIIEDVSIFAKLSPSQKEKIIKAFHKKGHVVGFLGDGINDGPALKAADIGISVDMATDIAKESADIILLEKSLLILGDGVIEGRKVFNNILKYIRMGASSNFGNMFSVVGASIFLPFLPMTPIQILVNNLLYDISQTAIPTDKVDDEYLEKPRKWEIGNLKRFILLIGPISSIFDYITYGIMIYVFHAWNNPALFHTGWFVESLSTQTLIIHVIRTNKIPFIQSRASTPLMITSLIIILTGALLPYSPLAKILGLTRLPALYWILLLLILLSYVVLTYYLKSIFIRKFKIV